MFKERIKTHHSAMSDSKKHLLGMGTAGKVLAIENPSDEKNGTIYIHVPFCKKICSFCNMRRSLQSPAKNYASLVIKEIEAYAKLEYMRTTTFDAVYFGGGTPTTLSTEDLCGILDALKANFHFTEDAEFTIETTVTELDEEKMAAVIAHGVNRFSVGVQTFDEEGRKKMGRVGSGEAAYERLKQLKAYEGVTVSMDLIYNYPEQTMESLEDDLNKIIALDLDGFSMYSLINMKSTSIDAAQNEENDAKMFFFIAEKMKKHGYHFLELTKMVKTDRYKYIMNRHRGADTLPLGAGAGGSVNGLAMMNPIQLSEYEESVADIMNKQGMLFAPEYKEVTRFKGALQTIHLPENEELYRDKAEYEKFREELLAEGMIEAVDVVGKENEAGKDNELGAGRVDGNVGMTEKGRNIRYVLTEMGIFWGNTISRRLAEML